ncbi:hypothetical protein BJX63DRAFT_433735 [Aspergillus granulosus]|uniref:Biogenesis of lysosome-related organelles complex 1 subunit 1 n=1 Tax=Aspergillus granulosus TaxID=176169 RepID=A0ABR4H6G3_9EURO
MTLPTATTAAPPPQQQPPPSPPPPDPSQPPSTSENKQTLEAKSAFTASLHSLGANYTSELVERAKILHSNSTALTAQEEQLAKTTEALRKQNESWEGIAEDARKGLKEIGDVQNWAEMIERDLLVVEETLRIAEAEEMDRERYSSDGERGSYSEEEGVRGVNGGVELNGNGKVGEEEGQKGKTGNGKEPTTTQPEKKGWFAWW